MPTSFSCCCFLILIQVKDGGPVLIPYIRSLPVYLCRIMNFKKQFCNIFIGCFFRIKNDPYRFGKSCRMTADLFIGRMVDVSANVTNLSGYHTRRLLHIIFHSPEAATGKYGGIRDVPFVIEAV